MIAVAIFVLGGGIAYPLLIGDLSLYVRNFSLNKSDNSLRYSLQKLKMDTRTAHVPIIICTGAKREVYEQEGWLTEKGVRIVLKPFDINDLERAISTVLERGVPPNHS